ncbi:hypothetical protein [Geobacter sp. SVR]|uniref:hypothetical protein n=1 Tax=Geobacter sp. SVR TaxID=2495594 RepID=UPI001564F5CB|nr:hypothetical protein [Geobacter sp. SVR]
MTRLLKHGVMLMLLATAGCTLPFTQPPAEQKIVAGRTTKSEVLFLLGEPDRMFSSGAVKAVSGDKEFVLQDPSEIWLYYPSAVNLLDLIEFKTLRIVFDSQGIVTYHTH